MPLAGNLLAPASVVALQRSIGNAAVVRLLQPRTAAHRSGGSIVQRRLPSPEELSVDAEHGPSQDLTYQRVYVIFHRMIQERRLMRENGQPYTSAQEAADDVFTNGAFDAARYQRIYQANAVEQMGEVVAEPLTVTDQDWPRVDEARERARELAATSATSTLFIRRVFGNLSLAAVQATYQAAAARLAGFGQQNFRVDYEGSIREMGVAGRTIPNSATIELTLRDLRRSTVELAVTILHEACHEVDGNIIDRGYYGTAGFNTMSASWKRTNAAHYEEVAMRLLGRSTYGDAAVFAPVAQQRAPQDAQEQLVKRVRDASEGVRQLWNFSLGMHSILKQIAKGESSMTAHEQVTLTRQLRDLYGLGGAEARLVASEGGGTTPVLTEVDFALLEGVSRVLFQAQKKLDRLASSRNRATIAKWGNRTPIQLAAAAVERAGYLYGGGALAEFDQEFLDRARTAMIVLNQPDPFPE